VTFFNCVADAVDEGSIDRERGRRAQAMWNDLRDKYRTQGHSDEMADAMAAEDVKAAFRKEAGDKRHVYLSQVGVIRKAEAKVNATAPDDLATMATSRIEHLDGRASQGPTVSGQTAALRRLFHYRLADLINRHSRDLLGNVRNVPGLLNVARELHGESTGDLAALAIAKGVKEAFRDMRRMFNEAGGLIGELDDWGLPHVHDWLTISRAGFDTWYGDIKGRIAWDRITDNLTGKPFAAKGSMPDERTMRQFLKDVYDNGAFGEGSREAVYGRNKGENLVKQMSESRVLHFRSADDWIGYNKKYGSGDIYGSIIAHAHRMSEDIVALREFGASPDLMLDYQSQLAIKKARELGREDLADKIIGNHEHARRMLRVQRGGQRPLTRRQAAVARFFSSARHIMTAALLDRAIVASISDTNTARMAALSMGMNQAAPFKRHMELLTSGASREQLARAGWIGDTLADPGLILSRWQSEVPPAAIAERISSGVMRVQGLAIWTDMCRFAFQQEVAGLMADNAGRLVKDVDEPLRSLLRAKGVTDDEWAAFTKAEHMWSPMPDAVFAAPMWWREATDLPSDKADAIFLKMQSLVEEQTEFAVPTQSLFARAYVEGDDVPGTIGFELKKSALMVKSFQMTFTVNQITRIMAQQGAKNRAGYAFNLAAGATLLGAVSLQLSEMLNGLEPQAMNEPIFWGRAMLKGGGFGVIGDIVAAGEASWGGGFGSYIAGPMPRLVGDTWNLSIGNALEAMDPDQNSNFGRDLVKYLDRWTPGADIPVVGLAIDRMVWDSLQKMLDPESETAMRNAATKRQNLYGNASWWMPGSPTPARAPSLGAALGQ
jgi:hypothetical protein